MTSRIDAPVVRPGDRFPARSATARGCAGCGGNEAKPLYRGLVECVECGLVRYPYRVAAAEAAQLYNDDYFHGAEYLDYLADRSAHQANFRPRVRRLAQWVPHGGRLFEVGCSYGLFLELARRTWQVRGCDIAVEPCRYARERLGLDVCCADFLDVPLGPGAVDAFCLWDTIEHLADPDAYLARMAEVLSPGGILALTTGDIGSRLARWQGPRWRQIHPPTHLWYFSAATMSRMLGRFGFDVVSFRRIGVARSVGQIVYSLTSLGKAAPSRLHRFCMASGLGRVIVELNTFDLMMVVARRRGVSSSDRRARSHSKHD